MSELPKGWSEKRLGEILTFNYGKALPEKTRQPGSVQVYGSNGPVGIHSDALINGPAIIIGRKGSVGEVHLSDAPCWPIDTTYFVNQFGDNSPEYWYWYLKHLKLDELDRATAIPGLNREDAYKLKVLVPPLAEQRRIVARLDALLARSKRARAELARVPGLVERQRQAVLVAAFRGELTSEWRAKRSNLEPVARLIARTPIPTQPRGGREASERVIPGVAALAVNHPGTPTPEGWDWVLLNRIARQETGHTPSRSHPEWWGGEIPWIGIKDAALYHGRVISETIQRTNKEGLANSAARLLPKGTVCLSRTASVGYVVIMGKDMATSQDFVTWTCSKALLPEFLMYALMAEGEEIRRFGQGSTHTTIYFPEVRALYICLAPLEEQTEIVRRIEAVFARINHAAAEAERATALLDRLDQATLARAFRGEL